MRPNLSGDRAVAARRGIRLAGNPRRQFEEAVRGRLLALTADGRAVVEMPGPMTVQVTVEGATGESREALEALLTACREAAEALARGEGGTRFDPAAEYLLQPTEPGGDPGLWQVGRAEAGFVRPGRLEAPAVAAFTVESGDSNRLEVVRGITLEGGTPGKPFHVWIGEEGDESRRIVIPNGAEIRPPQHTGFMALGRVLAVPGPAGAALVRVRPCEGYRGTSRVRHVGGPEPVVVETVEVYRSPRGRIGIAVDWLGLIQPGTVLLIERTGRRIPAREVEVRWDGRKLALAARPEEEADR